MRVKEKKVLKNGAVAGYVYYSREKKWKWRIISGPKKKSKRIQKGGDDNRIINLYDKLIQELPQQRFRSHRHHFAFSTLDLPCAPLCSKIMGDAALS